MPIKVIDTVTIGTGKPGELTMKNKELYSKCSKTAGGFGEGVTPTVTVTDTFFMLGHGEFR